MATYFGTTINDTPTIIFPAKEAITGAQCKAVTLDKDGVKLASEAGATVMGVIPLSEEDTIPAGHEVTVQIKDIGVWEASGKIDIGDELATDASGKAAKATEGQFVLGVALSAAVKDGTRIRFQMTKSGSKKN